MSKKEYWSNSSVINKMADYFMDYPEDLRPVSYLDLFYDVYNEVINRLDKTKEDEAMKSKFIKEKNDLAEYIAYLERFENRRGNRQPWLDD